MESGIDPPEACKRCAVSVGLDHWFWMKDARYKAGGKWRCREAKRASGQRSRQRIRADPERAAIKRRYAKAYASNNKEWIRRKAYVSIDRRRGFTDTISWEQARPLMVDSPCHYCDSPYSGGLDRKDSSGGHSLNNVVPCCEKCNMILGDLPYGAKVLLATGLKQIRERGLLNLWHPPQLRRGRNLDRPEE